MILEEQDLIDNIKTKSIDDKDSLWICRLIRIRIEGLTKIEQDEYCISFLSAIINCCFHSEINYKKTSAQLFYIIKPICMNSTFINNFEIIFKEGMKRSLAYTFKAVGKKIFNSFCDSFFISILPIIENAKISLSDGYILTIISSHHLPTNNQDMFFMSIKHASNDCTNFKKILLMCRIIRSKKQVKWKCSNVIC